eukprot:TRINITY_DN81552_c0_g1_i1.p1 TRINITY_DN81552_c0_g1~~TRINITY_DN81552_c0_g1_i1.p1  ORF type:complete len:504 (-),score=139.49 TRINITY_DN81552_c0_g1_i1:43-1554(-)
MSHFIGDIGEIGSLVILFLQLCTFSFTTSIPWTSFFLIDIFSSVQLSLSGDAYLIFFWVCVGLVVLLFVLIVFVSGACGDLCENELCETTVFFYTSRIVLGILFIPIVRTFLEVFSCSDDHLRKVDDMKCWGGWHIAYAIVGGVCVLCLALVSIVKAKEEDERSHKPSLLLRISYRVGFFPTKIVVFNLLNCLVVVFLYSEAIAVAALLTLMSIPPIAYVIQLMPYVIPYRRKPDDFESPVVERKQQFEVLSKLNPVVITLASCVCWINVCGVIASVVNDDQNSLSLYLILLLIVVVPVAAIIGFKRLKSFKPPQKTEDMDVYHEWDEMAEDSLGQMILRKISTDKTDVDVQLLGEGGVVTLCNLVRTLPTEKPVTLNIRGPDMVDAESDHHYINNPATFAQITSAISQLGSVKKLAFTRHKLDRVCATAIVQGVVRSNVEELELWGCRLDSDTAKEIVRLGMWGSSLRLMNLGDNPISRSAKDEIEEMVASSSRKGFTFKAF